MPSINVDVYCWDGPSPSTTCLNATTVQFVRNGNVERTVTTSCASTPHASAALQQATYTCNATNGSKSDSQTLALKDGDTIDFYLT
ncbi:MAG: hypothetical protein HZB26_08080 [Candidatus Hydrogenedentes bacterium]|nr:hypothetical protein [Candidatus Hydrogenedentota bacterium]